MDAPRMQNQALTAIPPHSTDAERSVLGALLQDGNALSAAVEALKDDDFYVPAHKEIFDAARQLGRGVEGDAAFASGQREDLFDGERGFADKNRVAGVLVSLAHEAGPFSLGCGLLIARGR